MSTKSKIIVTVVILVILLPTLPGLYLGGNYLLANSIKSSYQSKDCEQVISLAGFYTSLYPALIADSSIAKLVSECGLYSLALEDEQKEDWQSAYNDYKTYAQLYPEGLFAVETQEHSALALTSWAKEQLAEKKYSDALANAQMILQNFAQTTAAQEAASLVAEIYTHWASDQRDSSDFAGAEETLKTFKAWAENARRPEDAKSAQRQLAQIYLDWGLAFQEQKQFENAKMNFERAISTDPEPLAKSGPTAQGKAALAKLYTEWGDTFIEKDDFTSAINFYQSAISYLESEDRPAAQDKITSAYLAWAASLSDKEDFLAALKKVDEAAQTAATETGKKSTENAKSDTYTAFSKSSGSQASQAIKDATKTICEKNKKPALPIFGLDKDNILAVVYGVEDKFPDTVIAKTPGQAHYIACIDVELKAVETKSFIWAKFVREQYIWHITLMKTDTGQVFKSLDMEGGTPPPIPDVNRSNALAFLFGSASDYYAYRGDGPDITQVVNWLLKTMK